MRQDARISVVLPALNEERSIGKVLDAIPAWADDILVVDNGSADATAVIARAGGARVIAEPQRGYGAACLAGIGATPATDLIVFLDADFSDRPEEMARLVDPIVAGAADLVIGSRVLGQAEPGALTLQQRLGNTLACLLMRLFWGGRYTDLGPFRAISANALNRLDMRDRGFGWTIEMQIKALLLGLRVSEVPTSYRPRIGQSKISGTFRGTIGAGSKILWVIATTALQGRRLAQEERAAGT